MVGFVHLHLVMFKPPIRQNGKKFRQQIYILCEVSETNRFTFHGDDGIEQIWNSNPTSQTRRFSML